MNLLLFTAADRLDEQHIRVAGERLQHLRQVLGSQVGDELRVGEVDGMTGTGRLLYRLWLFLMAALISLVGFLGGKLAAR